MFLCGWHVWCDFWAPACASQSNPIFPVHVNTWSNMQNYSDFSQFVNSVETLSTFTHTLTFLSVLQLRQKHGVSVYSDRMKRILSVRKCMCRRSFTRLSQSTYNCIICSQHPHLQVVMRLWCLLHENKSSHYISWVLCACKCSDFISSARNGWIASR